MMYSECRSPERPDAVQLKTKRYFYETFGGEEGLLELRIRGCMSK